MIAEPPVDDGALLFSFVLSSGDDVGLSDSDVSARVGVFLVDEFVLFTFCGVFLTASANVKEGRHC